MSSVEIRPERVQWLWCTYFCIFVDQNGQPYTHDTVSTAFRRACKRAGILDLRFHDLRHDLASNLVQAGVDIYKVKELLGHKDLRMTVRYAHLAPENLRVTVETLDSRESGYILVTVGENKEGAASATPCFSWRPQRDSNPRYRLERAMQAFFVNRQLIRV